MTATIVLTPRVDAFLQGDINSRREIFRGDSVHFHGFEKCVLNVIGTRVTEKITAGFFGAVE
jgi:hypothetical protein